MKKLLLAVLILISVFSFGQNVGIGTTTPVARLHVADSNVIFSAATVSSPPASFGLPISGAGTRLMWMPEKSAFRVGTVLSNQWDTGGVAIGNFSNSHAVNSYAFGASNNTYGINSLAIGVNSNASGLASTAIGSGSNATGDFSLSMGFNALSSGFRSIAIGHVSKATGENSVSLGFGATARSYFSTALGYNNDSIAGSSTTTWFANDPLLYVGNGISSSHNAMVLYKNGSMVLKNPTTVVADPAFFSVPISGAGPSIAVGVKSVAQSTSVMGRPIKIFITYKE